MEAYTGKIVEALVGGALAVITATVTYLLSKRQSHADIAAKAEQLAANSLDTQTKMQAQIDDLRSRNNILDDEYSKAKDEFVERFLDLKRQLIQYVEERDKLRQELNRIHEKLEAIQKELFIEKERNLLLQKELDTQKSANLEKELRIQGLEAVILQYETEMQEMRKTLKQVKITTGKLKE